MDAAPPSPVVSLRTSVGAALHTADLATASVLARTTAGLSPMTLQLAFADWALHLAMAPRQAGRLGAPPHPG